MTGKKISTEPMYNIKSISEMTGIPPVTLRAWERRYGFPKPVRTDSGYRLFTEMDIAAVNWLRLQTEGGLAIGQAIKLYHSLDSSNQNPVGERTSKEVSSLERQSLTQLKKDFVTALLELDEPTSYQVIRTAQNFYPDDTVMLEIVSPAMIEIGELWHKGEISIATEHFATFQCRMHLMSIVESTNGKATKSSVVAACAPKEWHEIGLLILTIMLRGRGWSVTYLGQNISLERMEEVINVLDPKLLLFSASRVEAANELMALGKLLDKLNDPKPLIGLGGQAFLDDPTLTNKIPGTYFGPTAAEAVDQIERILIALSD